MNTVSRFSRLFPLLAIPFGLAILPEASALDYREDIRPILNEKCFKCHSGPRAKAGLAMDMDDKFAKRIGGDDDPVIIPGDPANSMLAINAGLPRTDDMAMPPARSRERGAEPLTMAELNLVKQWIAEGAALKAGEKPEMLAPAKAPSDAPVELLSWTNTAGNSLEAYFVSVDAANVTLKKEDGSEFTYPLSQLSAESQAQAKTLRE